jgi:hypothetical protein
MVGPSDSEAAPVRAAYLSSSPINKGFLFGLTRYERPLRSSPRTTLDTLGSADCQRSYNCGLLRTLADA